MNSATAFLVGPTAADSRVSRLDRVAYAGGMTGSSSRDTPTDAALMHRYRDGDAAAFETLYRRHNDRLYRYLLRLCRNEHTAEDLYQEVWGRVVKARHRYRPTAKFTTWLFRIAHNCFVDSVRRNRRFSAQSADPAEILDPGESPEQLTETSLARRRLLTALGDLPEEQRDVFLLYEEAALSLDEIASITGVNRETAKSRLRYANKKLRVALAEPRIATTDGILK